MTDFNFSEFIHMSGYAKYVWSSWAITMISMTWLLINALRKRKRLYQKIWQQSQQADARKKRAAKKK